MNACRAHCPSGGADFARGAEHFAMVSGETDSERVFALITLCIRRAGGDVRAGVTAAVRELAEGYELYSINFVLGEVGHLWAFRYPEHNPLLVLEHGGGDNRALVERDAHGTLSMRANPRGMVLAGRAEQSQAYERDDEPGRDARRLDARPIGSPPMPI